MCPDVAKATYKKSKPSSASALPADESHGKSSESSSKKRERVDAEVLERPYTLKRLVRILHISSPAAHIMPLLGLLRNYLLLFTAFALVITAHLWLLLSFVISAHL